MGSSLMGRPGESLNEKGVVLFFTSRFWMVKVDGNIEFKKNYHILILEEKKSEEKKILVPQHECNIDTFSNLCFPIKNELLAEASAITYEKLRTANIGGREIQSRTSYVFCRNLMLALYVWTLHPIFAIPS